MMEKNCAYCGKIFIAKRAIKKYCSDSCTQRAYLQRQGFKQRGAEPINEHTVPLIETKPLLLNKRNTKEPPPEKKIWPFIISEAEYYLATSQDTFLLSGYRWNGEQKQAVQWVNVRLKCLLNQLLKLCYLRAVNLDTYMALEQALSQLLQSKQVALLPADYPYTSYLSELATKIKRFVSLTQQRGNLKLIISTSKKAQIIGMIYAMGETVPRKKFSELSFN